MNVLWAPSGRPRRLALAALLALLPLESAAAPCPPGGALVVDPAMGPGWTHTSIQAAVDALPNPGPCSVVIRAHPAGSYDTTAGRFRIDGVNKLATSESQRIVITGDPGRAPGDVVLTPGSASAVEIKGASRRVTLQRLAIRGAKNSPVLVRSGANNQDIHLLGLIIKDNNPSGADSACVAIGSDNPRTWLANTTCTNNGSHGITVIGPSGGAVFLGNNTIHSNGKSGIFIGKQVRVSVINNLITANATASGGHFGLVTASDRLADPRLVTLLHNVFYRNGSTTVADIGNVAQTLDASDAGNRTTQAIAPAAGIAGCTFGTAPACDSSRPFTDIYRAPTAGDFHQVATAPSIDMGAGIDQDGVPLQDFEDDPRPGGPAVDAGSDEITCPDLDCDGACDAVDNCPPAPTATACPDPGSANSSFNPDQANFDTDPHGNVCDNCPYVSNADQAGQPFPFQGDACQSFAASGTACEEARPVEQCLGVVTLTALQDTLTIAPNCNNWVWRCESLSGTPLPLRVREPLPIVVGSEGPWSVELAAGSGSSILCDVFENYDARAVEGVLVEGAGTLVCTPVYTNFHNDLDIRPDGSCAIAPCEPHFMGQVVGPPVEIEISPDAGAGDQACSPGYWKQTHHLDDWVGAQPADLFAATFGVSPSDPVLGVATLAQALDPASLPGGGNDQRELAREGTAAYLNALHPQIAYPLRPQSVIDLVRAGFGPNGSARAVADQLAALLQARTCPLN